MSEAAHARESRLHADALSRMMKGLPEGSHEKRAVAAQLEAKRGASAGGVSAGAAGGAPAAAGPSPYQRSPYELPQELPGRRRVPTSSASGTRAASSGGAAAAPQPEQQYTEVGITNYSAAPGMGGLPSTYPSSALSGGGGVSSLAGYGALGLKPPSAGTAPGQYAYPASIMPLPSGGPGAYGMGSSAYGLPSPATGGPLTSSTSGVAPLSLPASYTGALNSSLWGPGGNPALLQPGQSAALRPQA